MDTNIYKEAIEFWGIDAQIGMLAEESLELGTAALHVQRGREPATANLAEEVADMEIMLAQLRQMDGMEEKINNWKLEQLYQEKTGCYCPQFKLDMVAKACADLASAALTIRMSSQPVTNLAEEASVVERLISKIRLGYGIGATVEDWKIKKIARLRSVLDRQRDSWRVTSEDARTLAKEYAPRTVRYVCQCGQAVQVQAMGDGFDAVLEIPCPSCGGRMIPEVDDDR